MRISRKKFRTFFEIFVSRPILESMRAVCLFLRTVINFVMRTASTLEIINGEQQALRKFSAGRNLSLLKRCFAPSYLADTFKTGQQPQGAEESYLTVFLFTVQL